MNGNDPFAGLPNVPGFTLTSTTVADGRTLAAPQLSGMFGMPGGQDISPQLSWQGAPAATKSYAITMYDPDAPTMSGFWHWAVGNVTPSVTSLPENAGDGSASGLPDGAFQLRNDAGMARFLGAAPPPGHGAHRYFITVHALDVDDIGVPPDATPALLGFYISSHVLARATIVPIYETPAG